MFNPDLSDFIPLELLKPIKSKSVGVAKKTFSENGDVFFGSFKTYGGTEKVVNGVLSIEDTAKITTWYREDIKSDCAVKKDDAVYEIIGEVEDVGNRHQFLLFKVRRYKGGA